MRLEAFQQQFAGNTNASLALGSPYATFLPTNQPTVFVESVDGKPVPPNPTGSFEMPDVAINNANPVEVKIKARNVPPSATVNLHVISENAPDQTVPATLAVGSTTDWTAAVTLPPGFSRGFVRATWTP